MSAFIHGRLKVLINALKAHVNILKKKRARVNISLSYTLINFIFPLYYYSLKYFEVYIK